MERIERIKEELEPLRNKLLNHRLYEALSGIDDIRTFMEKHAFAVWDFMSLLKALQSKLTCTSVPWKPVPNPEVARFINNIVMEEETDKNEYGKVKSHYEMYLDAMMEIDANTTKIQNFVSIVYNTEDLSNAMELASLERIEADFMIFTFGVIQRGKLHQMASAFTFGREELIPEMFMEIVKNYEKNNNQSYPKLRHYLQRHIELDQEENRPYPLKMIEDICGNDPKKWEEVIITAKAALQARINLWDDITELILENARVVE